MRIGRTDGEIERWRNAHIYRQRKSHCGYRQLFYDRGAVQESRREKGMLAIIGPKRMDYAKNKSLIEYMKKLLSSSLVVIFRR